MDFTDAQQYIFQGATVNNVGGNQTNINNVFNNAPSPPSSLSWQEIFVNTFSTRQQIQAKEQLHIARGNATTQLKATLTVLNACGGGDHVNDQISAFREEIADLQMIVDAIDDIDLIQHLSTSIENLNDVIAGYEGILPDGMLSRIHYLSVVCGDPIRNLLKIVSSGFRLFWSYDEDIFQANFRTILWSIHSFTVESTLALEFAIDDDRHIASVHRKAPVRSQTDQYNMEMKLRHVTEGYLPHAVAARWDYNNEYNSRMPCQEGTRVEILAQVHTWLNFDESKDRSESGQTNSIFWINGSAGTGKTTIAYTIAERCQESGQLGASFFCSADDENSSNPSLVFTTIIYQLGYFHQPFKATVSQVLRSDPDVIYAGISHQLKKLLVDPLNAVRDTFPPCVIILDALDECRDHNSTSIILSSLARYIDELAPVKFLITSRPVLNITGAFDLTTLRHTTQRCVLHEVDIEVVERDIRQFISARLTIVKQSYHIGGTWPDVGDVNSLIHHSSGLFIFAATAVKFIGDKNYSNPQKQLALLLASKAVGGTSPQQHLDTLYQAVLKNAFPNLSVQLKGELKLVLGSISLLATPLSPLVLDDLLGIKPGTVKQTLQHLHSVVIVPEDSSQVIRLIHPSFPAFLIDSGRCSDKRYAVTPTIQHTMLAISCFHAMTQLKRDICGIGDSSKFNSEIDDLSKLVAEKIPAHLSYACCHWPRHLCSGMISDKVLGCLVDFCSDHLLHWVEACSLIGELQNAVFALNAVRKFLAQTSEKKVKEASRLLHDCERLLQEFFPVLSLVASQVYYTALPFISPQTALYDTYKAELEHSVKVCNTDKDWHSCLRTMEGHSGCVQSVGFSLNAAQIISGSDDKTLKLWDAITGSCLNTITEHKSSVLSAAFSFDGTQIVSGSYNGDIFIWNASTGGHIKTLKGHAHSVQSVVFSPDGTKIVSGSYDGLIKVWDPATGSIMNTSTNVHSGSVHSVAISADNHYILSGSQDLTVRLFDSYAHYIKKFERHTDCVYSVAISPDHAHIASGSGDQTIMLWTIVTGSHKQTLRGHTGSVHSVAYSYDGTSLASGSSDKTIRLWKTATGEQLNVFQGHSHTVYSVQFSADGAQIVSGSNDKTLRLWDAASSKSAGIRVPAGKVLSLAFSPDGSQILSGTFDGSVQLWDAVTGVQLKSPKERHTALVRSVGFSPNGLQAVSGSQDSTIRIWDLAAGTLLKTLKGEYGHTNGVQSVVFSSSARYIISGSDDTSVMVWDAVTGIGLLKLAGHSATVKSVAISPNERMIASGSFDTTVKLWSTETRDCLLTLSGHLGWVQDVAISPDGTLVASASLDKTIRLWKAADGSPLTIFQADHITSITFSEDQTHIITPKDFFSIPEEFWPEGTVEKSVTGFTLKNEWICSLKSGRRLCWVPVAHRGMLVVKGNRVALGTEEGKVVVLNFASESL